MRSKLSLLGTVLALTISVAAKADDCPLGIYTCPKSMHATEPTLEEAIGDASVAPIQNYSAFIWRQGHAKVPAPDGAPVDFGSPGFEVTSGAGGWGSGGREPMALAQHSFAWTAPDGDAYFAHDPFRTFECDEGTQLCRGGELYYQTTSQIFRAYRITKTNPNPLPGGVSVVPVKVDYTLAAHFVGTRDAANASAQFGYFEPISGSKWKYTGNGINFSLNDVAQCTPLHSGSPGTHTLDGTVCTGTFDQNIPMAHLETIGLSLAALAHLYSPTCEDVDIGGGTTVCADAPYSGSGHVIADPYVYIDPDWEYASWFTLEISADETDTTWVAPERTSINTETLTADAPGGSVEEPVEGDDDGGGDGDGDGDGSIDGEHNSANNGSKASSGGCQLGGYGAASGWACLVVIVTVFRLRRRRSI